MKAITMPKRILFDKLEEVTYVGSRENAPY